MARAMSGGTSSTFPKPTSEVAPAEEEDEDVGTGPGSDGTQLRCLVMVRPPAKGLPDPRKIQPWRVAR
jgi:hypothetical protein